MYIQKIKILILQLNIKHILFSYGHLQITIKISYRYDRYNNIYLDISTWR